MQILKELQGCVADHFEVSIKHSTFQLEPRSLAADEDLRQLH